MAASSWALGLEQLDRLELFIEPTNEASCRTAEAAGYQGEGLLRSYQRLGGTRRDMVLYARLGGDGPVEGPSRPGVRQIV